MNFIKELLIPENSIMNFQVPENFINEIAGSLQNVRHYDNIFQNPCSVLLIQGRSVQKEVIVE